MLFLPPQPPFSPLFSRLLVPPQLLFLSELISAIRVSPYLYVSRKLKGIAFAKTELLVFSTVGGLRRDISAGTIRTKAQVVEKNIENRKLVAGNCIGNVREQIRVKS